MIKELLIMFVVVKTCCQNETHQSKKCLLNNSIASFSVKVAQMGWKLRNLVYEMAEK